MNDESQDYERTWDEFWKPLVCKPDGTVDMDAVKRELHDYQWMMENTGKVFCAVSGGSVSKPNTTAAAVIGEYEEDLKRMIHEAIFDELEPILDIVTDPKEKAEIEKIRNGHES